MPKFLFSLVLSHYFLKLKDVFRCCISLHRVTLNYPARSADLPSHFCLWWCWIHFWDWVHVMGFGVMLSICLYIQISGRRAGIGTWEELRGKSRIICTPFVTQQSKKTLATFLGHSGVISTIVCLRKNVTMKQLCSSYCVVCKVWPYLSAVPHCHFNAWWKRAIYVLFLDRKWILKESIL